MADVLRVGRVEFAQIMLRYQHPWLYAELFGADAELVTELNLTPERIDARRGPREMSHR